MISTSKAVGAGSGTLFGCFSDREIQSPSAALIIQVSLCPPGSFFLCKITFHLNRRKHRGCFKHIDDPWCLPWQQTRKKSNFKIMQKRRFSSFIKSSFSGLGLNSELGLEKWCILQSHHICVAVLVNQSKWWIGLLPYTCSLGGTWATK